MVEVIILGLLVILYLYFKTTYHYWTRKGLTQATPIPLVGNASAAFLKKKNMGLIHSDIYWQYRNHDAVGYYEFITPKLMIIKPELIKEVLVSKFSSFHDNQFYALEKNDPYLKTDPFVIQGEKWKEARNRFIHGQAISKMREIFTLMKQTIAHLDSYIAEHTGHDVKAEDMSFLFTMTNVSNTVFGIESNCFTDTKAPFRQLSNLLHKEYWRYWWQTLLIFYLPKIRDMLGYSVLPKTISVFVEAMVRKVAEARRKSGITRNDYAQSFLSRSKPYEENVMDMIYNGIVFFLAGTETSSLVSTNTLYELAMNPDIQERLYQELREAYSVNSELDYGTLKRLPYLDKITQESLRKYPIMFSAMKVCTQDTVLEIDGKEVKIKAGTMVTIPTFAIQRDEEYYPEPDVFDPERFSGENKAARPEITYLPWGEGPRVCAGKRFGLIQVKLYISHIAYNYRILATERTPQKLSYNDFGFLVVPSDQIWIRLEKRV